MEGNRRLSLSEQMSATEERRSSFTGLTLDAILGGEKRPEPTATTQQPQTPPSAHPSRTLLDIIRDEEPDKGQRDKKSWKTFRDRLRLKRAGAAWTSSVHIPASDIIPVHNNNSNINNPISPYSGRNSHVRFVTPSFNSSDSADFIETVPVSDPPLQISRPVMTRRGSTRFVSTQSDDSADIPMPSDAPPPHSFRPQISRHNSTRHTPSESTRVDDVTEPAREGTRRLAAVLAEERALSAREAVAAQEAAEAEAAAAAEREAENAARNSEEGTEAGQPVRMSLMDLLEETDRQMGVVGSRYMMGDDDEVYDDDEEYDDDEGVEQVSGGGVECTCCVCMVRHKGAAFIPCGHTFCRLCSRELWVQRGNCPLCNGFILEILDIF